MSKITLKVKKMHCKSCKMIVEEALSDIGAKDISVTVDEKKQIGTVSFSHIELSMAKEAIKKEGYEVV